MDIVMNDVLIRVKSQNTCLVQSIGNKRLGNKHVRPTLDDHISKVRSLAEDIPIISGFLDLHILIYYIDWEFVSTEMKAIEKANWLDLQAVRPLSLSTIL